MTDTAPLKILALSGGGAADYATAVFLHLLEQKLPIGKQLCEEFDLICGVSTGAILTAGLCKGMPAADLVKIYKENLPMIFKKRRPWSGYLCGTKYDNTALMTLFNQYFPESWTDLEACRGMVHATMVSPSVQPQHWKSWSKHLSASDMPIRDVLAASTAAPGFFPPHSIGQNVYVDGGLTANDPSVMAIAEANKLGYDPDQCVVLSVTPMSPYDRVPKAAKKRSFLSWATSVTPAMMAADEKSVDYQMKQFVWNAAKANYLHLNLGVETAMDDASEVALGDMAIKGMGEWTEFGDQVMTLLGYLPVGCFKNYTPATITIKHREFRLWCKWHRYATKCSHPDRRECACRADECPAWREQGMCAGCSEDEEI